MVSSVPDTGGFAVRDTAGGSRLVRILVCLAVGAVITTACAQLDVEIEHGKAPSVVLDQGRGADLSLLPAEEQKVVADAMARAEEIRKGRLFLLLDSGGVDVELTQVEHGFRIASAIDLAQIPDEDLGWFTETFEQTFNAAVLANSMKWRPLELTEGERRYERVEETLDFVETIGVPIKAHTLVWGLSVPNWLRDRYPNTDLDAAEAAELKGLLEAHVRDLASRYDDRIDTWDVVNESTAFVAQWFINRLGREVVAEAFAWARDELGDDDVLLLNEWIGEQLKLPIPTVDDVAAAVDELRAAGVEPDGLGHQAHFAPALAHQRIFVEDEVRIPLDQYAETLNELTDIGLPIHVSEFTAIRPTGDEELRAAQTEGLMWIWFGHEAVEEITFWGFWEGRHFLADAGYENPTLWTIDRQLTRQGETVLSLLNDRWRSNLTLRTGGRGAALTSVFHGEYLAEWEVCGKPRHARFTVTDTDLIQVVDLRSEHGGACD